MDRWEIARNGCTSELKMLGRLGDCTAHGWCVDIERLRIHREPQAFAGQSAYLIFVGPFRGQRLHPQRALHQAMAVGVEAIPIVSLITFFVGLISWASSKRI